MHGSKTTLSGWLHARIAIVGYLVSAFISPCQAENVVSVGSKNFPENYLLAEIAAQWLEHHGYRVQRETGFGGTQLAFEALRNGEIDFYPEYTGTIDESILKNSSGADRASALERLGLRFSAPLGFNNTYVLATRSDLDPSIQRVSDIEKSPSLRLAFSYEFMNRTDGWPGLSRHYGLAQQPRGIEHGLAYQAIANDEIDITDAYSTDGDIERFGLRLLVDDRNYFPRYDAGWLQRSDLDPRVQALLTELEGSIDADKMRSLNAEVVVRQRSFAVVARQFLLETHNVDSASTSQSGRFSQLRRQLGRHMQLTGLAIFIASIGGVALALISFSRPRLAAALLYVAGLMQTVPSIALLALLIPLLGIGFIPALTALVLYALLPILRATLTALGAVDVLYRKVAAAIGMSRRQEFRHVLLPLALPHVLAGVRTASIICIGTATLAAFIGAGGLGEPIVTGLALNDTAMILSGAIPAALLAIATDLLFDLAERRWVPEHMRVSRVASQSATRASN